MKLLQSFSQWLSNLLWIQESKRRIVRYKLIKTKRGWKK